MGWANHARGGSCCLMNETGASDDGRWISRAVGDLETLPPDKSAAILGRRGLEVQHGNGESRVGWRQTLIGGRKDSERSELFGKQRR